MGVGKQEKTSGLHEPAQERTEFYDALPAVPIRLKGVLTWMPTMKTAMKKGPEGPHDAKRRCRRLN
jgi:hypothetical protein